MTSLISLKKSQQDKFIVIKKSHQLWLVCVTLAAQRIYILLTMECATFPSLLVTFLVALDSSYWNLFDGIASAIIGALTCLRIFFFFFICSHCNLWREMRDKKKIKKKSRRDNKALIMIPPILLERF